MVWEVAVGGGLETLINFSLPKLRYFLLFSRTKLEPKPRKFGVLGGVGLHQKLSRNTPPQKKTLFIYLGASIDFWASKKVDVLPPSF